MQPDEYLSYSMGPQAKTCQALKLNLLGVSSARRLKIPGRLNAASRLIHSSPLTKGQNSVRTTTTRPTYNKEPL